MNQNELNAQASLPQYKSHKTVEALKIKEIIRIPEGGATIVPENENFGSFTVSEEFMAKHNPSEGGYHVRYSDGYESWSPADAFEEGYTELKEAKEEVLEFVSENGSFGQAIQALKQGKRVARTGWNGKGMFIFMQVPAAINEEVIPKMQSLPQAVKDEFSKRLGGIKYKNQLAMVYPDNTVYGWVASPSDVLENDWCILD